MTTHKGFYNEISKYYDNIFPAGNEQIMFLKEVLGNSPKTVLDIACGTGGYSLALAKEGHSVTASDLDYEMLNKLSEKAQKDYIQVKAIQSDMLDLEEKLDKKFDLVFCIGNSLVHLSNMQQIKEFLISAKRLTEKNGSLVIQIINFDRILLKDITSLPTIEENKLGLNFERNYKYDKQNNTIYFNTKLTVGENSFENEVSLYPLLQDELMQVVNELGFVKVKLFGDFCGNEYDKYNSFMLVLWAR